MSIKEQIRAEIERLKNTAQRRADNRYGREDANTYEAWAGAYEKVLEILDSIPEQPVLPGFDEEGIPGRDFIPVAWVDACERYGKWKIVRVEQPDGLEEEIERFKEKVGCPLYWCDDKEQSEWVSIIARHFAEWGAEHLRDTTKMIDEGLGGSGGGEVAKIFPEGVASIHYDPGFGIGEMAYFCKADGLAEGDKVKILIIKEN